MSPGAGPSPIASRWRRLDQRVRYLVVGGWNSVVAYGVFAVCWFMLHELVAPSAVVLIAYAISSLNGYVTFRYLVFTASGHPVREYLRYQAVYLPILALNAVALPVALALTGANAYLLQLLFAVVAIVLGYLGNRFFVFRRRATRPGITDTTTSDYSARLEASGRGWRRALGVQAPYRWNIRHLQPGWVLDVGCGVGRNLGHLDGAGVGVDHNQHAVAEARRRGLLAFTPDDFAASEWSRPATFDSLLVAHVLEHLDAATGQDLLTSYLPFVKPGGRVIVIVPQEAGYASDASHVRFLQAADVERVLAALGLATERSYSFPFPRRFGRLFRYNETVVTGRLAGVGRQVS